MKRKIYHAWLGALSLGLLLASSGSGANTLTANVADYNAAKVATADGVLTVPANLATYSVTGTSILSVGSNLVVTLPLNFAFASTPSLSNTGTSTFTLVSGGSGSRSATFQIATAALTSGQSASLDGFMVQGATALETLTPVADALPLTVQAIGNDPTPLSVGAFASEPGTTAIYVGAIQFIDQQAPSLGKLYYGSPDTTLIVTSATAISAQTVDYATSTAPVLNPDGSKNSLAPGDTATITIGGNYLGIVSAFSSSTSDCKSPISQGSVTPTAFTVPDVALNTEVFFCINAGGVIPLQYQPQGFVPVTVTPGTSTDFLSPPVTVEFPGYVSCQVPNGNTTGACVSKAFAAGPVSAGGTTTLTFVVDNTGFVGFKGGSLGALGTQATQAAAGSQTGLAFTDNLPPGLAVASPNGLTGSCGGGTITAFPGSHTISLAGGSLATGATCTFSVDVAVLAGGAILNVLGPVISDQAPAGGGFASAQINVIEPTPTLGTGVLGLLGGLLALLSVKFLRRRTSVD
ncbi:MAG: hypothetical protein P4L92_18425 [Rudaea sp.]|nr:hypothetical protein [Rudaea sp.]